MKRLVMLACLWCAVCLYCPASANWTEQMIVNQGTHNLQASRDSDTPLPIAIDDSNRVHFVFETQDDQVQDLAIHYRIRFGLDDWSEEISATERENIAHRSFGHPSIVIGNDFKGYVVYVMDSWGGTPESLIEMRSAQIDLTAPGNLFQHWDYMSNQGFPNVNNRANGARKTPVITKDSLGLYHGFWIYRTNTQSPYRYEVYHNTSDDLGWGIEDAPQLIENSIYQPVMLNAKTDPEGNIHLLVSAKSDSLSPSVEVYEFWYEVRSQTWHGPKLVSGAAYPDGDVSWYAYGVFSGGPNDWRYHIVWQEQLGSSSYVQYRRFNSSLQTWSRIKTLVSPTANYPCLAVDSDDIVHFVWDDTVPEYEKRWLYHGYYNPLIDTLYALEWLPNVQGIRDYTRPVVVADRWDNLHVVGIAHFNENSEVLYSFYDAPPRAPRNLVQLFGNQYVTISWHSNPEPDLDHYIIKRQIKDSIATFGPITDTFFVDDKIPEYDGISRKYFLYWVHAYDTLDQESLSSETLIVFVNPNWPSPKSYAGGNIPTKFALLPNTPNPFNSSTEIKYALPIDCYVTIEIYDIAGRRMRQLVDEPQSAGYKSAIWNGRNDNGEPVASGMYLYQLSTEIKTLSGKIVLLK